MQIILNIIRGCLYFVDLTTFYILVKFFVGFLENLRLLKRHSEINWPLERTWTMERIRKVGLDMQIELSHAHHLYHNFSCIKMKCYKKYISTKLLTLINYLPNSSYKHLQCWLFFSCIYWKNQSNNNNKVFQSYCM